MSIFIFDSDKMLRYALGIWHFSKLELRGFGLTEPDCRQFFHATNGYADAIFIKQQKRENVTESLG